MSYQTFDKVLCNNTNNYINEGERIMKNLILTAVIAILLFMGAEGAHAWSVTVKNNDTTTINVKVYYRNWFWWSLGCEAQVRPKETGICEMPGAWCPQRIIVDRSNQYDYDAGMPKCWNTTLEVEKDKIPVWR
jgi:hypothetical protein